MSTTHQTAKATAIAAIALAMSIGATIAPAQAAPYLNVSSHINLRQLSSSSTDVWVIDIQGVVTMSEAAARDSISHGHTIQLRYWGDDPSSDDLLAGPVKPQTVFAAADGLHYQHDLTISRYLLDEDSGTLDTLADTDTDEIYVGVRFVDPYGKTLSLVESDRIVNAF